jgi:sugar O-acyltransferase (sialic acid O-acetyltransferase NeuD family)
MRPARNPFQMKQLAIYGAGGFGREMALMVEQMNDVKKEWEVAGFFDDGRRAGEVVDGLPVLGGIGELNAWKTGLDLVVAVADPRIRKAVVEKIRNDNVHFPAMVHPKSMGSSRNLIGRGSIITAGCILTTGIEIKDFVIVNLLSTLGHDVKVGSYTSIMPGSNISGAVTIGEANLIGTGVQILQGLSTGDHCRIGAGAVLTRSVAGSKTITGIPARERQ